MSDLLERLAAIEAAMTPGPWEGRPHDDSDSCYAQVVHDDDRVIVAAFGYDDAQEDANTRGIAAARTLLPELIAYVRAGERLRSLDERTREGGVARYLRSGWRRAARLYALDAAYAALLAKLGEVLGDE